MLFQNAARKHRQGKKETLYGLKHQRNILRKRLERIKKLDNRIKKYQTEKQKLLPLYERRLQNTRLANQPKRNLSTQLLYSIPCMK